MVSGSVVEPLMLGPDLVRADGLDLVERVLASGHADRDHQDKRSRTNHVA
jgi:hypothetical protein